MESVGVTATTIWTFLIFWPEPWAGEAFAQAAHVEARMRVAYRTRIPDEQRHAAASAVEELLASVRVAVMREEIGRGNPESPSELPGLAPSAALAAVLRMPPPSPVPMVIPVVFSTAGSTSRC